MLIDLRFKVISPSFYNLLSQFTCWFFKGSIDVRWFTMNGFILRKYFVNYWWCFVGSIGGKFEFIEGTFGIVSIYFWGMI